MYVRQNEKTLENLVKQYRLGIVAQSYGNLPAVLVDFGLASYFTDGLTYKVTKEDIGYRLICQVKAKKYSGYRSMHYILSRKKLYASAIL